MFRLGSDKYKSEGIDSDEIAQRVRTLAELFYDPKQAFKQGTEDSREGP